MNIADRIQHLRKTRGISQEQLADSLGVSRQSVSKWESEQSVPDIDKVVLMSELFDVTTDYLLKGIEPSGDKAERPDARVYALVGTAINLIGVFTAIMIWIERRTTYATFSGMVLTAVGCAVIAIGLYKSGKAGVMPFLTPNVWITLFIPLSALNNLSRGLLEGYFAPLSPYPTVGNSFPLFFVGIAVQCALCAAASAIVKRRVKKSGRGL